MSASFHDYRVWSSKLTLNYAIIILFNPSRLFKAQWKKPGVALSLDTQPPPDDAIRRLLGALHSGGLPAAAQGASGRVARLAHSACRARQEASGRVAGRTHFA